MDATPIVDVTALEPGDLLACYGSDEVSRTITLGTGSLFAPRRLRLGPSHIAIAAEAPPGAPASVRDQRLLWYESTSLCGRACVLGGKPTAGLQAHRPADRLADYRDAGGRVEVYRLDELEELWPHDNAVLTGVLAEALKGGVKYDMRGAVLAGLWQRSWVVLPLLSLLVRFDGRELFCSEVVGRLLMRIGRMDRARPATFTPASLLRRVVRDATYGFKGELRSRLSLYREQMEAAA